MKRVLPALLLGCLSLAAGPAFAAGSVAYEPVGLTIAPGSSSAELGFAWFSADGSRKPVVQLARKADMKGDAFPAGLAKSFTGTAVRVFATAFNGDDKPTALDRWADKVTVTGLAASTDYVYRVGDGSSWTAPSTFGTRDPKAFGFIAAGDPQLGSKATGAKTLEGDAAGWADTVAKALGKFPASSFMVCLGDQVNDYSKLETQEAEYAAFFGPAPLRSLPLATVDGNHDFQMGEYYGYHYNQPNLSAKYGVSYGNDGDYWFSYGSALFLMLNSNAENVAAHDAFIRDAVAANPSAKWRIACFHHSLYSEAEHFADPDVMDRRSSYPPVFERYKIDVALSGHDHSYTRTLPLRGGKPADGADPAAASAMNPAGIVYFTLDSGSGSKFYEWHDSAPEAFSAFRWQGKVPTFSYVSVDSGSLSLTTYRTDDMSAIDTFTIIKK